VAKFLSFFWGFTQYMMQMHSQMAIPQRFASAYQASLAAMGRELWLEGRPIAHLAGNRPKMAESPMFGVVLSVFGGSC
jgi:hypothetical protein